MIVNHCRWNWTASTTMLHSITIAHTHTIDSLEITACIYTKYTLIFSGIAAHYLLLSVYSNVRYYSLNRLSPTNWNILHEFCWSSFWQLHSMLYNLYCKQCDNAKKKKNNSYNLQLIDVEWLQSIPLVFIN